MPRVLVPLAQGCEELEAVTIIDLLRRADIDVVIAGLTPDNVIGSHGICLVPDRVLDEVMTESFDMIVLPGGLPGSDHLDQDARVRTLLQQYHAQGKYTAAICAAPKALASAGLLDGRQATSYPGVIDAMHLPSTQILRDKVVVDGRIVTSRGPGTAMDFALTLIELLLGPEQRKAVEDPLVRA